jgi:hypothetical protein
MDLPMIARHRWLRPVVTTTLIFGGFALYLTAKEATIPLIAAWLETALR